MSLLRNQSHYGTCTQIIRFLFILFNSFHLISAITTLIVAIVALVLVLTNNYTFVSRASFIILILASVISIVVSVAGFIGGIFMLRPFLITFSVALGILSCLVLAGAGIAFVQHRDADSIFETGFSDAIEDFGSSGANSTVEVIQRNFSCCGVDNYTDWERLNPTAVIANGMKPPFCECNKTDDGCIRFDNTTNYVWEKGCRDDFVKAFRGYTLSYGISSILQFLIMLLGITVAVGLTITITRAVRDGTTKPV